MKLREIRLRVLSEHEKLRSMLDELDALNKRFDDGEAVGAELRESGVGLFEAFAAHLRLEDSTLPPVLLELPQGGPALADRLQREHREQRSILQDLLTRLEEQGRPTALVSRELRQFAASVRQDMQYEEQTILREGFLRDPA
jgi:hemerythrin-like domain-containing protein